jgi:tRNA 5-methylaminomethyl-2-thiouridine biosynthesis bifunctional protein
MATNDVSPILFDPDGPPRSRIYDDIYFSREDGLAEARAVFLAGCGLPDRWAGRRRFVVGELGFGTGLNVAALLQLWRERPSPGGHLHIFSVEAHPIGAAQAEQALKAWPELAPVARPLLARWPGRRSGFHRVELPELSATLDVAAMEADAALSGWSGRADAWFLDGFAPAKNPAMWTPDLMSLVAERSAPGAVAATYTVARGVRDALAEGGFEVSRRPGFGRKCERLEARLPGAAVEAPEPTVAVVGAGVAGAALARALRARGAAVRLFDAAGLGAGASGNPAALVTPRLDAGLGPPAQLFAEAFARAVRLYPELPDAVVVQGVLQLAVQPRDEGRFARIAGADLFEPGSLELLDAPAASTLLGESAPAALKLLEGLVIDPAPILEAWAGRAEPVRIVALEPAARGWRLLESQGEAIAEADVVCLALGADLPSLWPAAPIRPVRGQLSQALGLPAPACAWGGYVAPTRDGMIFGATHDRDDAGADWRAADDARNLATLAARLPALAAKAAEAPRKGRASVRATTPDRLPLAGAIGDGLFVLGGLGSRGFVLAPLLAEHVAAVILGAPSPLRAPLARLMRPDRFAA